MLELAEIVLCMSLQASHNMYSSFERNEGDSTTQISYSELVVLDTVKPNAAAQEGLCFQIKPRSSSRDMRHPRYSSRAKLNVSTNQE